MSLRDLLILVAIRDHSGVGHLLIELFESLFDLLELRKLFGTELFPNMQPDLCNCRQADAEREFAIDKDVDALWIFGLCPEGGDLSCWHLCELKSNE